MYLEVAGQSKFRAAFEKASNWLKDVKDELPDLRTAFATAAAATVIVGGIVIAVAGTTMGPAGFIACPMAAYTAGRAAKGVYDFIKNG